MSGTAAGTDDIHTAAYRFRNRARLQQFQRFFKQTCRWDIVRKVARRGIGSAVSGLMRMPNWRQNEPRGAYVPDLHGSAFPVTNQTDNAVFQILHAANVIRTVKSATL